MTKILFKSIEWLVFIVLIAVAIAAASPLLPTKNLASFYVVVSGSMEPAIPTGSLILTKGVDTQDLQQGDVIAFTSPTDPNKTITHRIQSITNNGQTFTTKGDNNDAADAWVVSAENIKGQFIFGIPYVGYAIEWARTPLGFAVVIGIPALIFVALQIKKIRQGINEEVDKRSQQALQQKESQAQNATAAARSAAANATESADSPGPIRRIGPIALAILLPSTLFLTSATAVQAYFSSTVTLTGITLSVADTAQPAACPTDQAWAAMFNGAPFEGLTGWPDSWLNPLFNWDQFWQDLGIDAPSGCAIPVAPDPAPQSTPTPTPTPTPSPTPSPTPTIHPTPIPTPTTTPAQNPQSTSSATSH